MPWRAGVARGLKVIERRRMFSPVLGQSHDGARREELEAKGEVLLGNIFSAKKVLVVQQSCAPPPLRFASLQCRLPPVEFPPGIHINCACVRAGGSPEVL
jgi:hypothetical protein